jgi:hypothetical protein
MKPMKAMIKPFEGAMTQTRACNGTDIQIEQNRSCQYLYLQRTQEPMTPEAPVNYANIVYYQEALELDLDEWLSSRLEACSPTVWRLCMICADDFRVDLAGILATCIGIMHLLKLLLYICHFDFLLNSQILATLLLETPRAK